MATRKEVIEELDDDLKEILTDLDATKAWTRTAMRIADALEHLSGSQTLSALTMMGFKVSGVPKAEHLGKCPTCQIIRNAQPPSPIDSANGGIPIIGRKGS